MRNNLPEARVQNAEVENMKMPLGLGCEQRASLAFSKSNFVAQGVCALLCVVVCLGLVPLNFTHIQDNIICLWATMPVKNMDK